MSTDTECSTRTSIRTAWDLLEETGAANVGGLMDAEGVTPFERAVAAAMTSRLGVGSARFTPAAPQALPTPSTSGCSGREWLDRMGGYDTRFVRAQDWGAQPPDP